MIIEWRIWLVTSIQITSCQDQVCLAWVQTHCKTRAYLKRAAQKTCFTSLNFRMFHELKSQDLFYMNHEWQIACHKWLHFTPILGLAETRASTLLQKWPLRMVQAALVGSLPLGWDVGEVGQTLHVVYLGSSIKTHVYYMYITISISCNCSPHSPPSHPVRWSFTLYVFHRCAAIWVQCHHHILALLARMVLSLVAENTWMGSVCETSRPKVMSPGPCPVTLLWLLRRT